MSKVQANRRFKWMLLVTAILLLPLLIVLGLWQIDRAQEKQQLLDGWQSNPAVGETVELKPMKFGQVMLRGSLDSERYFLLDNRMRSGVVGYEVIAVLLRHEVEPLLVNLGWLPAVDRHYLPRVDLPAGEVIVSGMKRPVTAGFSLAEPEWSGGWPARVQTLDRAFLSQLYGQSLATEVIQINSPVLPDLDINWPMLGMTPMKHWGYAFQWFAMALALSALLLWSGYRLRREALGYE